MSANVSVTQKTRCMLSDNEFQPRIFTCSTSGGGTIPSLVSHKQRIGSPLTQRRAQLADAPALILHMGVINQVDQVFSFDSGFDFDFVILCWKRTG
jgi:hypothetical protein